MNTSKTAKIVTILFFSFLLSVLIYIYGCSNGSETENVKSIFGIYFLKDTTLTYIDLKNKNIDTLKLQDQPWLSDKIIDFYDFSSHCIYLKVEKTQIFPDLLLSPLRDWRFRPFFFVANSKIIYYGVFNYSSDIYIPYPIIDMYGARGYRIDVLPIFLSKSMTKDLRNNDYVKKALLECNKYSAGINIEIDSIKIINGDTTLVDFRLIIKNNDKDNLYIFDPDKAGAGIFQFYGARLWFYNKITKNMYYPEYEKVIYPDPTDKVDIQWFSRVESGKTIERKFVSQKYKNIPQGNYYIYFENNGPYALITKELRYLENGRIWIGPNRSNIMDITIEKNNNCIVNDGNVILE